MNDNMLETLPCISRETRSRWLLQRIAILRSNPNFISAAADYAEGIVGIFEGRYMANKVMANTARQVICMSVLALHFGRNDKDRGAVVSSLQQITSTLGVCSPNTTAATIDLLENVGLVTRIQDARDHRNHLILPTERLITSASAIVDVALSAADRMFPLRHYRRLMSASGDFMERYFASSLHSLLNIGTLLSNLRASRLFTTSESGAILLCKLMWMKSSSADDGTVSFPFDEIGHLYGVSRTHIRRLMQKAEAEGLVRLLEGGGRRVEVLPTLMEVFANIVAVHVARVQFNVHLANRDYDLLPMDRCA